MSGFGVGCYMCTGSELKMDAKIWFEANRFLQMAQPQLFNRCNLYQGLQTSARGAVLPGPRSCFFRPQRHFVNNNEKIIYIRKIS